MQTDVRFLALLLCSTSLACGATNSNGSEANQAGDSHSTGASGAAGLSGSGGSGSTATPNAATCGLPAAGNAGVAQPSGDAANLEVLDWAGFSAAVSYTFDDANSSQIEHYAELQGLGVPLTFYLQTGKSSAGNEIWEQALRDGHELGNHTQRHMQAGTGDDVDLATTFIEERFGVTPYTMAAPYGDLSYVSLAEERFFINRGVGGGRIVPNGNSNPFNLPCHIPAEGAEASAMNGVTDTAHAAGAWQIVLVHGFTGGSDAAYQPIAIEEFVSSVEYAKALNDVWLDTVMRIGAYWLGQKAFEAAAPTTSGGETTWSWTLPEHFPPNTCLRVRVDGGTLTQGGAPLEWDEHGYYHIALDTGSLTLAQP